MMHQPISSFFEEEDGSGDIVLEMIELIKIYNDIVEIFAERTGAPIWAVIFDIERDVFMSAEEAQDHGIVDLIGIEVEFLFRRELSA
jgi:ATP-dependent protease ClpP protease subunit